jgi:hypothetical protein
MAQKQSKATYNRSTLCIFMMKTDIPDLIDGQLKNVDFYVNGRPLEGVKITVGLDIAAREVLQMFFEAERQSFERWKRGLNGARAYVDARSREVK